MTSRDLTTLPRLDEHGTVVSAPAPVVLVALGEVLDDSFSHRSGRAYARLVGCRETSASGPRPLAVGSTVPGFRVAVADEETLVLLGRHRFSDYALVFHLDAQGGATRLRAETRAHFPGPHGRTYRFLLLRTGGHAFGVRRLLAKARALAERT